MTQEALKKMYQLLLTEPHAPTVCAQLERIAREALADHAMQEVQRIGQEIEQEPPKYSFKAHWEKDGRIGVVGAVVRPDGGVHLLQDIIDPPQRTERPVDCERCNRLEEQAYDLVGELRVANIKLSMRPQRTWVGLTDEEI